MLINLEELMLVHIHGLFYCKSDPTENLEIIFFYILPKISVLSAYFKSGLHVTRVFNRSQENLEKITRAYGWQSRNRSRERNNSFPGVVILSYIKTE